MRNKKKFNDMFNLIKVVINFNDKLYKKVIKKNIINFEKKQNFSLNQRLNINKENLVLIKNTIILIIINLHF